jgi:hypothetical protein
MTALSLILPCFNEAERLPATLSTYLLQLPTAPGAVEVLADGRRMLGEVWSVRRALGPGHPSGEQAYAQ